MTALRQRLRELGCGLLGRHQWVNEAYSLFERCRRCGAVRWREERE